MPQSFNPKIGELYKSNLVLGKYLIIQNIDNTYKTYEVFNLSDNFIGITNLTYGLNTYTKVNVIPQEIYQLAPNTVDRYIQLYGEFKLVQQSQVKAAQQGVTSPNNGVTLPSGTSVDEGEVTLYNGDSFSWDNQFDQIQDTSKNGQCTHEFKFYQGLNEAFEYCVKCDKKREVQDERIS